MNATGAIAELAEWTRTAGHRPARWPLCALVIGDTTCAEFSPVVAALREETAVHVAADLESALGIVRAEESWPDCIVLLESRPGELARQRIDELRAGAPLARVICVLGSWCEGEFRSGQPWPAAPRVYGHQFRAWFRQELAAIERGDCPPLLLPITATEEERLLQSVTIAPAESTRSSMPPTVAIYSQRREMVELLADACRTFGILILPPPPGEGRGEGSRKLGRSTFTTPTFPHPARFTRHLLPEGEGHLQPSAAIWDFATAEPPEIAAFAAAAARLPETKWIALVGFPREDLRAALLRHGASEVLSKPLVIDQLRDALATQSGRSKNGQRLLFF